MVVIIDLRPILFHKMADVDDRVDMDGDEEEQDPGQDEEQKYANLDAKTRERVKEVFQIFDKEQQQFIDAESLGTLLRWLKFNPTEVEMAEYVRQYDAQGKNQILLDNVMEIVNNKILEPDTIDEFIEAAKVFDHDNDGKIEVAELRYAMSCLGDKLDENAVDDLIAELDREKTGFVDIVEWARITFK